MRRGRADVLVIDDRLINGHTHPLGGTGPRSDAVRLIVIGIDDDPTFAARARRLGAEHWIAKEHVDDALRVALA